jgi:tetratricopeptide (TPR) repeat protein
MKGTSRTIALTAIVLLLIIRVAAQTAPEARFTAPRPADDEQQRIDLINRFMEASISDEWSDAFEIATTYVKKYPGSLEVVSFQRWIADFPKARKNALSNYVRERQFQKAFKVGRGILKAEPRDFRTLANMVNAALGAALHNDPSLLPEAGPIAKLALALVESREATDEILAPASRDEMLAWLYRSIGFFSLQSQPAEAVKYLHKALQYQAFQKDPYIYAFLAEALIQGEYKPLYFAYIATFPTWATRGSQTAALCRARINQSADLIVDAAARFLNLAQKDPGNVSEEHVAYWFEQITNFYKSRNSGFDTGLQEYIDGVFSKPLGESVPENE